jgi:hypothetical protein
MTKLVVGLFETIGEADRAVQELIDGGFPHADISAVANDPGGSFDNSVAAGEPNTAEGAGVGAVGGSLLGGTFGLLVGLGVIAIPGLGPVLAAGPLLTIGATALGAGVGAGVGGVLGALTSAGVPEHEAHFYNEGLRTGGSLVTVTTADDEAGRAAEIMRRGGAVELRDEGVHGKGDQFFDPQTAPRTDDDVDRPRTAAGVAGGAAAGAAVGLIGGPGAMLAGALAGATVGGIVGADSDISEERGSETGHQDPDQLVDSDPRPDRGSAYRAEHEAREEARGGDDHDSVRSVSGHPEASLTRSLDYDASVPSSPPEQHPRDHESAGAAVGAGAGAGAGAALGAGLGVVGGPPGMIAGAALGAAMGGGMGAAADSSGEAEPDIRGYREVPPESVHTAAEDHENSEYLDESARETWRESSKLGTGGGTLVGVVAGAAIGATAGPVGALIGGVAGAITGAGLGAAGDVIGQEYAHGAASPQHYEGQGSPHDHAPRVHRPRRRRGASETPREPGPADAQANAVGGQPGVASSGNARIYDVPPQSWAHTSADDDAEPER